MRKDILIRLVKQEAKSLLKYAKKSELKNLDFKTFDPDWGKSCIYGQITGDCLSGRAISLINKCCDRVYEAAETHNSDTIKRKLNGSPRGMDRVKNKGSLFNEYIVYYSPIEHFILLKKNRSGNNKILIEYLRGERKTLNFK